MSFDRPDTTINFSDLNGIRDELIKIECGIETINMYRKYVLKEPEQPWLEEEMQKERAKIKVATSSKYSDPKKKKDYSKMADWEGETNKELNRLN